MQERLGVLLLDAHGHIIAEREVFVGTLHTALVSTRDVLRLALSQHAKDVVFHNHPSSDTQPSDEDVAYHAGWRVQPTSSTSSWSINSSSRVTAMSR